MLKLLIVDDEKNTREGLINYINWQNYGIEVIGEASDGLEALETVKGNMPDIVITDVKMPKMDGIQLAKKLREMDENIRIIFISGYDHVDYLKTALKVDAEDYIMKPINLDELENLLNKIIENVDKETSKKRLLQEMNTKLYESMPLLRVKYLTMLINDEVENVNKINNKLNFLDIMLPLEGNFCVFVISIDDKEKYFEKMSEKNKQLSIFALLKICEEHINQHLYGLAFENKLGEYVCIISLQKEEDEDILFNLINEIRDEIIECLKISITIGVGSSVKGLEYISRSYKVAFGNCNQKLFLGKNRVINMDNLEIDYHENFDFKRDELTSLYNVLKAGDREKTNRIIDDIFERLAKNRIQLKDFYLNVCLYLMLEASKLLLELVPDKERVEFGNYETLIQLFKTETVFDMKNNVKDQLFKTCDEIISRRDKKSNNTIGAIKDVIHKRYNENLEISTIAKQVYLTTTYVCMIFKQETGETINEYITKVRIEKAKEMLKDPKKKACEICYEVGYSEPNYFAKVFKKCTGLTPSHFRENVL